VKSLVKLTTVVGRPTTHARRGRQVSTPSVGSEQSDATPAPSPFHRLADFLEIPRVGGLALSSDGTRLAVSVSTLDAEKKKWQSAVWEIDPTGEQAARRLTRSGPGESAPTWLPDGSLLFTSARPDPDGKEDGDPKPALWNLPAGGGEARLVLTRPAGVAGFSVAADSGDVVVAAATMPGAADADADEERRKKRKDAGVTAVLHDAYPVRYWDTTSAPRRRTCSGRAGCRPTSRRAPPPTAPRSGT
jgi:dipeptidyl aminopeptidase/acylaminoacyl peptidase